MVKNCRKNRFEGSNFERIERASTFINPTFEQNQKFIIQSISAIEKIAFDKIFHTPLKTLTPCNQILKSIFLPQIIFCKVLEFKIISNSDMV